MGQWVAYYFQTSVLEQKRLHPPTNEALNMLVNWHLINISWQIVDLHSTSIDSLCGGTPHPQLDAAKKSDKYMQRR